MNHPLASEEWWLVIARAHQDCWNLYESSSQATHLSDENESQDEPDFVQANHIVSDLAEKTVLTQNG